MAISIPSISEISASWVLGAGAGAAKYRQGVTNSAVDWEGPTSASEDSWRAAIQEAAAAGRFGNGVAKAGNSKWRDRASTLGAQRFASGIAAAADDFQRGFAPFRDVIANLSLPPRGPRGSAANLERVRAVTDALHQRRLQELA